jgi:hypothetical protein
MAKKKTKPTASAPLTPEKHIRTRMRSLPVTKCLINNDWKQNGMAIIIVIRQHKQGSQSAGFYLVDTQCLGVKDSFYNFNCEPKEIEETIDQYSDSQNMQEISYNEIHNIIYGAIAFAEDGGIEPCKSFELTKYFLQEDDDEVPLIEYDFGMNGKHLLMVNSRKDLNKYLPILRANLPEEEIDYIVQDDEFDNSYPYNEDYAKGEYTYQHPDYPTTLNIKHPWVFEELNADKSAPVDMAHIKKVLELPKDELRQDLEAILYYALGLTADNPDNEQIGYPLVNNAIMLLGEVGNADSIDVILECMSQNDDWLEFYICDNGIEILSDTLYFLIKYDVNKLLNFLYRAGVNQFFKSYAANALSIVARTDINLRGTIIAGLRKYMQAAVEDLPQATICDGALAGMLVGEALDIDYKEFEDEIRALYDTQLIDESICGSYVDVLQYTHNNMEPNIPDPDILERIKQLNTEPS